MAKQTVKASGAALEFLRRAGSVGGKNRAKKYTSEQIGASISAGMRRAKKRGVKFGRRKKEE